MRFRRRLLFLFGLHALGLVLVLGRVVWLQTIERERWEASARETRSLSEPLAAPRGRILDRAGLVMAYDEARLRVVVVPAEWERRGRMRCSACGAVRYFALPTPGEEPARRSRTCSCERERARIAAEKPRETFEDVPAADPRALDLALGLPPGTLAQRADARLATIADMVGGYRRAFDDAGASMFADTRIRAFEEDMKNRPFLVEPEATDEAARLVQLDEAGSYRGFHIEADLRRRHPLVGVASHLLGYATKIRDARERAALATRVADPSADTRIGRTGVERAYDSALQGRSGWRSVDRDEDGEFTRVDTEVRPGPGQDVELSLDAALSQRAQSVLETWASPDGYYPRGRPSAALIMLDAETGEILVWADLPTFDLDREVASLYLPLWSKREADRERREWMPVEALPDGMDLAYWQSRVDAPAPTAASRVAQVAVEPGSTFKPFVGLALLERGHLAPEWQHACAGNSGPGCHRCGTVDLVQALTRSCNKYFAWYLRSQEPARTSARLADVGAFVPTLGFGLPPNPLHPEWAAGTWMRDGYDFSVATLVDEVAAELAGNAARNADGETNAHPPVKLHFQPSPKFPTHLGGDARALRASLVNLARHVAARAAAGEVRLGAAIEGQSEDGRQLDVRFDARAVRVPAWSVLPGDPIDALPPTWRTAVQRKTMGLDGNPARGGSLWLRWRLDRRLGRPDINAPRPIHPHDAESVAIGQGPVLVTPLQMAQAMAAIANGGWHVVPHAVRAVGGRPVDQPRTRLPWSPISLAALREGMLGVTDSPAGTARSAGFQEVPALVYGKTGTAQVGRTWRPWHEPGDKDLVWHHWFAGFAEAPGRRSVAFACVLHARTEAAAGATAAKAVAQFLRIWFES